jgi:hypothetical protein
MINTLIWFLMLFQSDPNEVLVGQVNVYMNRDFGTFTVEYKYDGFVFGSPCDLALYICAHSQMVCTDQDLERIKRSIEFYNNQLQDTTKLSL